MEWAGKMFLVVGQRVRAFRASSSGCRSFGLSGRRSVESGLTWPEVLKPQAAGNATSPAEAAEA